MEKKKSGRKEEGGGVTTMAHKRRERIPGEGILLES